MRDKLKKVLQKSCQAMVMLAMLMFVIFGLTGCGEKPIMYNQTFVDDLQETNQMHVDLLESELAEILNVSAGQEGQINIMQEAIDQLEQLSAEDKQIIDDYKEELALQEVEEQEIESAVCLWSDEFEWKNSNFTTPLDDNDLELLSDGEIEFDGDDYDISETLELSDKFALALSLNDDEEMAGTPYIKLDDGAIRYTYNFDERINMSLIDNEEPLKITFLGVDLMIVNVENYSFTIRTGEEFIVTEGEVIVVDGQEILIKVISEDKIAVEVGDEFEVIDKGDTDDIGDLEIYVDEVIEGGEFGNDYAVIIVESSTEVDETYDRNDEVVEDVEDWVWTIETDGDDLVSIGVEYSEKSDELDDDFPPLALGDYIALPFDFMKIYFDEAFGLNYVEFNFDFDEFGDDNIWALHITCDEDNIIVGDEELNEVWFNGTLIMYEDEDGKEVNTSTKIIILENDETELEVKWNSINFTIGDLKIAPGENFTHLGDEEEDAEGDELVYDGEPIGTKDYDVLTPSGMLIEDPESNGDNDEVVIQIPNDDNPEIKLCVRV